MYILRSIGAVSARHPSGALKGRNNTLSGNCGMAVSALGLLGAENRQYQDWHLLPRLSDSLVLLFLVQYCERSSGSFFHVMQRDQTRHEQENMSMLPGNASSPPTTASPVNLSFQTSSSSPSPSSSSDASPGHSPKLSRRVQRSSRNCRASSLSTTPTASQLIFRCTHWPTKSAYCVSRSGNVHPDASVDTIGTERGRVRMPWGV